VSELLERIAQNIAIDLLSTLSTRIARNIAINVLSMLLTQTTALPNV
jgi:hypothetical protein